MAETSPSPVNPSPSHHRNVRNSAASPPTAALSPPYQHTIKATYVHRSPAVTGSLGKPSPYVAKAQAGGDGARPSRSGIGGPVKRRESMSGIGNNLRSHNPAGLGRSVGKAAAAGGQGQQPSGLSKLLRRTSTHGTAPAAPAAPLNEAGSPLPAVPTATDSAQKDVRRRGSVTTASATTADASVNIAGPTVFPTNSAYSPASPPEVTRKGSISVRYASEQTVASAIAADYRQSPPVAAPGPAPTDPAASFSGPMASSPLNVRIVRRSISDTTGASIACSPASPTSGMTIGSPNTGGIIDVVGSPSRPSVVYAAINKGSGIGGADSGKTKMQRRASGIGGSTGKDWMADRPSGMGTSVPQNSLPASGLSQALKSLVIDRKKNKLPEAATSPAAEASSK